MTASTTKGTGTAKSPRSGVQSVHRALDVLFSIAGKDRPQAAVAIAQELDLPRPTVYRILNTMIERGIVARVGEGFRVTPKLVQMVGGSRNTLRLAETAGPFLQRLVDRTNEAAGLHVRIGMLRRCVAEVEGLHGIRWARGVGYTAPLWQGAIGHVLLAGLSSRELSALLPEITFEASASGSVMTIPELEERIDAARRRGWSSSISEAVEGAAAVAAPIVDGRGTLIAALGLFAPAARVDAICEHVPDLMEVARELSDEWAQVTATGMAGDRAADTGS
jgi:DNA-binding IclR family transcriptional regulator